MESLSNDKMSSTTERLVLVSDSSTEAERLIASLRVRKVKVRDVPLMLLAGRVEAQKPMLVICDGLAPRVAVAIEKMRQGAWGKTVDILLLGVDQQAIEAIRPVIADIDSRCFARPIDVYSVLQRVEEILGESEDVSRGVSRSMASLPRVGQNSIAAPKRPVTPVPRRGRSSIPQSQGQPPGRSGEPASSPNSEIEPSRSPSVAPASDPNGPDSALVAPSVSRMSEELENLLQEAERRLGPGPMSIQPMSIPSSRLSPEQELDAILPADVLAALDEPVDLDDDDETSHPAIRSERPSSMAPRATSPAVFPVGHTNADVVVEKAAGTSPSDEDTPVGRVGGRRYGTSIGSDVPSAPRTASVLTPLPPSVKVHTATGTDALGQSLSGQTAATSLPAREFAEEAQAGNEELHSRGFVPATIHRPSADSVAPGTNPELEESRHQDVEHDVSSTAPPHPPRHGDFVPDFGRDELHPQLEPPRTVNFEALSNRDSAVPGSTSPPLPGRARGRGMQEFESTSSGHRAVDADYAPAPASRDLNASLATTKRGNEPRLEFPSASKLETETRPGFSVSAEGRSAIEIPPSIGKGDVVRSLSRCVRGRYSGALAIEDDSGIRRVVFREGDFVMVASGIEGESLVAFLIQRGDLDVDAARLTRKLPQFGRHAGAALIAHGYLRQDELWPVLRAHAEWLLGKAIFVQQGSAGLEVELSARLQAEPAVFGGTTGAEVLVEIVRRTIGPDWAIEALGGTKVRVARGPLFRLLSECALASQEVALVERANGVVLGELIKQAESSDFAAAIYALVELSVLSTLAASTEVSKQSERPPARDGLDDGAVRSRVGLRRALVDEADYFALLGIQREATGYEVRHAYLTLRREFDPAQLLTASTVDLREDVDLIVEVLDEAYEILRDSARRERYRRALEASPR